MPKREHRSLMSMPVLAGAAQLRELVHVYGGFARTSRDFRIAESTLAGYLSGKHEPPYTLLLALYWQGPYGFEQAFSESHYTHQENWSKRRAAEERVAKFEGYFESLREMLMARDDSIELGLVSGIEHRSVLADSTVLRGTRRTIGVAGAGNA